MKDKNETKVWKVNVETWIEAETKNEAIANIHSIMENVCKDENPFRAYEPKSAKLDYIELDRL